MKTSDKYKTIYNQIDIILWHKWDPIGVNGYEEARDEYHSYLPHIVSLKMQGASIEDIGSALYKIETERMCLVSDMERCKEIAAEIVDIK